MHPAPPGEEAPRVDEAVRVLGVGGGVHLEDLVERVVGRSWLLLGRGSHSLVKEARAGGAREGRRRARTESGQARPRRRRRPPLAHAEDRLPSTGEQTGAAEQRRSVLEERWRRRTRSAGRRRGELALRSSRDERTVAEPAELQAWPSTRHGRTRLTPESDSVRRGADEGFRGEALPQPPPPRPLACTRGLAQPSLQLLHPLPRSPDRPAERNTPRHSILARSELCRSSPVPRSHPVVRQVSSSTSPGASQPCPGPPSLRLVR